MNQIETSQKQPQNKFIEYFNNNRGKILSFFLIITSTLILTFFLRYDNEKKNSEIADKYSKATYYLASSETDKAKLLFEQILVSKNELYSILSLNAVIEKNLILDREKIINYFNFLEINTSSEEQKDLLILKKALYLIKKGEAQKGNDLLKLLIDKNSNLKSLAQEIVNK